jgi:WhiB family redox-sensing transcriptional regulator
MLDQLRPDWHADAACRDTDPATFFPTKGVNVGPARKVCARCPVRDACLAFAMSDASIKGVWAGTTERQRKRMRRRAT